VAKYTLAPLTGHRADIQVLRGLAVLLVVLYHAEVVFPGGYIGVDVFFVISGFVIGRILFHELITTDRLSFRAFYARRFRRLLPALALMLIVVVLVAPLLAPIGAAGVTNPTAAASALFSANFYLYAQDVGGYFATASTLNPLLHTWSLAVEEQFYLAIPALLLVTWRVTARRTRIAPLTTARVLVAGITLLSLFACILLSWRPYLLPLRSQSFAYFSPFTRAWEFCFGLGLVLLPAGWVTLRPAFRIAFGVLGYAGIMASALMFTDSTTFPSYRAVLPVAATALAILAAAPTPRIARPLVFFGDNSYGWYLWHWPLIVFAAALWPQAGVTPLIIAAFISLLPAVLSRQLLERRLVPRFTRSQSIRSAGLLAVACIALPFLAIAMSRPITTRTNSAVNVARAQEIADTGRLLQNNPCDRGVPLGPDIPEECVVNPDGATTITLIGDSNAGQFLETLRPMAEVLDARIELAAYYGCPVLGAGEKLDGMPPLCSTYTRDTLDELSAHPRDIVIIGFAPSDWLATHRFRTAPEGAEVRLVADTRAAFNAIIATGARTVLIEEVPKPEWADAGWHPANCSALAAMIEIERCGFQAFDPRSTVRFDRARSVKNSIVSETGVESWNFDDLICVEYRCTQFIDGAGIFGDPAHLSNAGASRVTERMLELLREPRTMSN
jgi:peptidoglycan/LPS O-acetylase OafA/YrhL